MEYVAKKEKALQNKIIPQTKRADFEEFWASQVNALRQKPLKVTKQKITTPYDKFFTTYEVTFNTCDDTIVNAYFTTPNNATGKLPCVALFGGGGSSRDIYLQIASTGVCCFAMDNRSQGGITFDKGDYSMGDGYRGSVGACFSFDILDKERYYMRNLYLDAVRAIDVISALEEVDSTKIVSHGISQGGALSIVSAALSGKVIKTYPVVPSFSCLVERVEAGSGVFSAVKAYLTKHPENTDKVMNTLSYFDINNIVSLLKVPSEFMLGLIDPICLPEFVYSVYAHAQGEKQITIEPFTPHNISLNFQDKLFYEFGKLTQKN